MKLLINNIKLGQNKGKYGLYIELPPNTDLDKLQKTINHEKAKTVDIEVKREKRSLSANAYCWVLLDKMAKILCTTAEEQYLLMLQDYGVHEYTGCLPETIPTLKKMCRVVEVKGKCMLNNMHGITVKLTLGSSEYDSKQMSTFIEGIISQALILGIETKSPAEIKRLLDMMEG